MTKCKTCGQYYFFEDHCCLPAWRVWECEDNDIYNGKIIFEIDEEEAAKKWAEYDDVYTADYSIVSGTDVYVFVCSEEEYRYDPETVKPKKFLVSGESVPKYYAREVESITHD